MPAAQPGEVSTKEHVNYDIISFVMPVPYSVRMKRRSSSGSNRESYFSNAPFRVYFWSYKQHCPQLSSQPKELNDVETARLHNNHIAGNVTNPQML
mmetsp:Transcript_1592/g.2581  ORF Transcript_1592/g.2581 Transcript_1592/m.2581 type:complete len:96 (-) Transcript_1592:188-475(-)